MSTATKDKLEIERDAEKARKSDIVTSLAESVGGEVRTNDYDGPYEIAKDIGGVLCELVPDWHKRRWVVTIDPPRSPNRTPITLHGDPRPSCTVAMDRAPAAIVRDIERRFVPVALAWLERANAKAGGEAAHEAAIAASIEAVKSAAAAAGLKCRESSHYPRQPGCEGQLWINGQHVRVSANWFQAERPQWPDATALVAAIALMRKGEE
jgi:hypothetical protein